MATPVVTVASGGLPVVEAANGFGTPVSEAANGRGLAVTKVTPPKNGVPVVYLTSVSNVVATQPTTERA